MNSKSLNKHTVQENMQMAYSETRQFKTESLINQDNIESI